MYTLHLNLFILPTCFKLVSVSFSTVSQAVNHGGYWTSVLIPPTVRFTDSYIMQSKILHKQVDKIV